MHDTIQCIMFNYFYFFCSEWQNHNGSKLKIKIKRGASKHNASYSCLGRNAKGQEIVTTGYVGIGHSKIRIDCICLDYAPG